MRRKSIEFESAEDIYNYRLVTFNLEALSIQMIDDIADEEGMSRSAAMRAMLNQWLSWDKAHQDRALSKGEPYQRLLNIRRAKWPSMKKGAS